jgi:uncharacterized protein (PEP-CTERM system associated)
MTITTAKRPDILDVFKRNTAGALKLAPLALAAMLLSAECRADWQFTPNMELRETYSDNAGLQPDEFAQGRFISEAVPGFMLAHNSRRLKLNANAQWRLFAYGGGANHDNLANSERRYQAQARSELVDQLLYLDASTSGSRQSVSAFGPVSGSTYSTANRTDLSTWSISPYLRHRFGTRADLTVRFTRDSVEGATGVGYGNSLASTSGLDLVSGTHFDRVGWNLNYNRRDESNSLAGSSTAENSMAGLTWKLKRDLSLTAGAGYDSYDYPTLGDRTSGRRWSSGFIWTPSSRTSVEATFGHRYFGKTGSLAASHRSRHTVWSLDYRDEVTNSRSQLLLPSALDTAAMLDRLFASVYPDAAARQAAVQAYIAATGLPPTLADNINYLSNRYIRDRRLQGALTLRGARTGLTFSVFRDERNALSLQQSDSTLLGNQLAALNDNVRQHGASAVLNYRLSQRTTALASLDSIHAESLTTGAVNNANTLRLAMTRAFGANTRGSVEVHHARGDSGVLTTTPYRENAIVATLNVQY